ncbi:MAG: insulinase family protein [Clostridiales bacterium]|jgi:predicted Zn-dependent peptidase|nr:insulinase family protein [Clostridiales bacterium]
MFNVVILDNGLKVALEQMDSVRTVSFGIWVRNGSRNESPESNGISHFIEHMLFKGTSNRSAKQIADDMDEVGGHINAYTTKEYTCYFTKTLSTHFDVALDVLSDMFFNSEFQDSEIKKERNVILEEIDMYEDAPEEMVHDLLQYSVWQGNPLGYPVLGAESSISNFDHDFFVKYFHDNYYPERTVITAVGCFDSDEAVKKIERIFGNYKNPSILPPPFSKAVYKSCISAKPKEIEQMHLCLGFPCIPAGDPKYYDLIALNTIFGGGMSSRLFQTIREDRGLAYSVYSYSSNFIDTGLFSVYAGLNANQAEEVIKLIFQEIKKLLSEKIGDSQLRKTREQLKSNLIMAMESPSNKMSSLGRSQLIQGRSFSEDQIMEKLDEITYESIRDMAEHIFQIDQVSLSVVGNYGGLDFHEIMKKASAL